MSRVASPQDVQALELHFHDEDCRAGHPGVAVVLPAASTTQPVVVISNSALLSSVCSQSGLGLISQKWITQPANNLPHQSPRL